jgi:hypothetical protein
MAHRTKTSQEPQEVRQQASAKGRASQPFSLKLFIKSLGPGLITGASDDDPSGIGTYSQAGAQFGYGIGWTMLLTFPLMAAIQEISARVGRVTGHGISGNVCRYYPEMAAHRRVRCCSSPTPSTLRPISAPWRMRPDC